MPFDFSQVTAPFRMQPGLRRVAAGTAQLTPTSPGSRHLREKIAVLSAYADQALVAVPGFDAAPVWRALAAETARASLSPFTLEDRADGLWLHAPRLGWSLSPQGPVGNGDAAIGELLASMPARLRPTALLCLAFEEDFAVIDGATATIPWLAVCLPSRWAPETKVGRHFAEVHAPVADGDLLRAASESLSRLVTGGERWERFVWTISPEPRLHQHPARGAASWPTAAFDVGDQAWFRSEHQTFVPLPGAQQAVFTIHVETRPLCDPSFDADAAGRVHAAIASMSADVLAYRGMETVRKPLLAWLAMRSAGPDRPAP